MEIWNNHNKAVEREIDIIIAKAAAGADIKLDPNGNPTDESQRVRALQTLKRAFLKGVEDITWSEKDIELSATEFVSKFFVHIQGKLKKDPRGKNVLQQLLNLSPNEDVRVVFEPLGPGSQCAKAGKVGAPVDDPNCYICGVKMREKGQASPECEHILPAFTALGHGALITRTFDSEKDDTDIAELFRREYAYSHQCCNRVKSDYLWIKFKGKIDDPDGIPQFEVNYQELNTVLNKLPGYEGYDCKTIKAGQGWNKEWVTSRKRFIVDNYLNPMMEAINANVNANQYSSLAYHAHYRWKQVNALSQLSPAVLAAFFLDQDADAAQRQEAARAELAAAEAANNTENINEDAAKRRLSFLLKPEYLKGIFLKVYESATSRPPEDNALRGSRNAGLKAFYNKKITPPKLPDVRGNFSENSIVTKQNELITQLYAHYKAELTKQGYAFPPDTAEVGGKRRMKGGAELIYDPSADTELINLLERDIAATAAAEIELSKILPPAEDFESSSGKWWIDTELAAAMESKDDAAAAAASVTGSPPRGRTPPPSAPRSQEPLFTPSLPALPGSPSAASSESDAAASASAASQQPLPGRVTRSKKYPAAAASAAAPDTAAAASAAAPDTAAAASAAAPAPAAGLKRRLESLPGRAVRRGFRGGFRFTIRRRSDTRQTKKNRRRKVIEVSV
jgi:hypothetical protein